MSLLKVQSCLMSQQMADIYVCSARPEQTNKIVPTTRTETFPISCTQFDPYCIRMWKERPRRVKSVQSHLVLIIDKVRATYSKRCFECRREQRDLERMMYAPPLLAYYGEKTIRLRARGRTRLNYLSVARCTLSVPSATRNCFLARRWELRGDGSRRSDI